MKPFRIILAGALALAMAFLAGCSKEEQPEETGVESTDAEAGYAAAATISSSSSYFTATDTGGRIAFKSTGGSVRIFVDCGAEWYAENSATDSFTAEAVVGTGTLTISAGENHETRELSGTVTLRTSTSGIQFAVIEVTQNAYGAPEISVDVNEWRVPAFGDGLSTEIGVSSSLGDFDVAKTNGKWLTVIKTDTGISITAEENEDNAVRTATLTLSAGDGYRSDSVDVIVTQDGVAYITLETEEITASAAGDVLSVAAVSNFDLEWTVGEGVDWLSVETDASGLVITVAENETVDEREAVVAIAAGDGALNNAEAQLTVIQEADNPDSFILEYSIQQAGQTVTLPLSGTVNCIVNWGDGTKEAVTSAFPSHTYQEGRIFDVTVTGTVTALYSKDLDDLSQTLLTDVVRWGNTGLEDVSYGFTQSNVRSLPADTRGAFAKLTAMDFTFYKCYSLTDISSDLFAYGSNLKSLNDTFYYCKTLETVPEGLLAGCTAVTSVQYLFYHAEALSSVPAGLFSNCTKITDMTGVFSRCSNLTSLPSGLFDNCPDIVTFYNSFSGSGLTSIPEGLFDNNTKVYSFVFTFNATNITSIPSGLFDNCTKVTDFQDCFYQCYYLESIPAGLFDKCPNVDSFHGTFWACYALKEIPDGLFSANSKVTDMAYCFWQCKVLERLPDGLFDAFSKVTTFYGTFCYCYDLAYVPEDLFKNCSAAEDFTYCFNQCWAMPSLPSVSACTAADTFENAFSACSSITEIPSGFFANCTKATSFRNAFAYDTKIASIPAGLFDKCTAATDFYGVFSSCTAIPDIPEGLFANCTSATNFSGTFNGCTGITSVQEDLFAGCTKATDFSYIFGNTSISVIPKGLFANCTSVTTFAYAFAFCANVTEIPESLFAANVSATNFTDTFYGCTGLKEIPAGIFANNAKATNFYATFGYCTALTQIPTGLFDSNTKVTNFQYTFLSCSAVAGESPYTEIDGVKVHLYERKDNKSYFSSPSLYSGCFEGCDGLTDLADIKSAGWY